MFCPKCGVEVNESSNFCSNCGGKLSTVIEENININKKLNSGSASIIEMDNCVFSYKILFIKTKIPIETITYFDYKKGSTIDNGKITLIADGTKHEIYFQKKFNDDIEDIKQFLILKNGSDITVLSEQDKPMTKKERIKQNKENAIACCPKCGSTSLTTNKQGFGIGKAIIGRAMIGDIGLIAGNINSKKINVTCLNCGHQFKAGKK
ncbi:MAG: zinc ribbon domain-containing protein [Oscillospiraceae bacterium]|nr:zinc ribbon domain-containing protein [Oscillospiraceae bacterium]